MPGNPYDASNSDANSISDASNALTSLGRSGVEGVPGEYFDGITWMRNGFRRHRLAVYVALVVGWTGIWIALWGAAFGAIAGIFVACGVITVAAPLFATIGGGNAVTFLGVIAGIFVGAAGGFLWVLKIIFVDNPIAWFGSFVAGAIVSVALVIGVACFERMALRWRGYRRLSRDEVRKIAPIVKEAADALDLEALPRFAIQDNMIPNAWAHMRTVVLTTGLLSTLSEGELRAILTHELHHWNMGDSVGLHFVWAASWPAVLLYNFGTVLSSRTPSKGGDSVAKATMTFVALFGWFIAWPAWILTKCVVAPLTAASQRRYEYEADAAALNAGFGADLATALKKISAFEGGRTGWEHAMTAHHPPVELRLERLQPARDDDWEYQEDELRRPSWKEIRRVIAGRPLPKSFTLPQTPALAPEDDGAA